MRLAGEGAPGSPGGPCPPPAAAAAAAMAGFIKNCSCAIWNIEARSPAPPGAPGAPGRLGRPPAALLDVGTPRAPRRGFCGKWSILCD